MAKTPDQKEASHQVSQEPPPGFTPETLNVPHELAGAGSNGDEWPLGDLSVTSHQGRDAFWFVVRRQGRGGVALRTFPIMGAYQLTPVAVDARGGQWKIETHSGIYSVKLALLGDDVMHMTTTLTPSTDLLVTFWPRDLYVLDADDNPARTSGSVEAAQRGLNGGYCYLCLREPDFGSVLYLQNFSALADFFAATQTTPDGVVGGQWPELGYQPPSAPLAKQPPANPLKAGVEVTISDAYLAFSPLCAQTEFDTARTFIEKLAAIYRHLDRPPTQLRDWTWRAQKTHTDLRTSPKATLQDYGCRFIFPYTDSEYPDSMVQMSVLATLWEYEQAHGIEPSLSGELSAGMRHFFDEKLGTLRRYLPNVGVDKNKDAVDSWYLYHPLMNLARLAINGEGWAKDLFFDGLEFVIKAAQHFEYKWPIIYDLSDFSVVQQDRGEGLGQTDVGGIYAYVMLQAHQLTADERYVDEARKALKAAEGYRFELAYQTNLTAWGATACLKLYKLTEEPHFYDQSLTFVASFLHNCELWHSKIKSAANYANFFGVTCLHDGPYMAAYEAFECFMAFDEFLQEGGSAIDPAVQLLLSEYWRNSLDVLWSFYPDTLPKDALATEVRNGHIDPELSFPLEDVYGDGSPAGQVGQEIYGAGAAFVLASRAFRNCPDAPLRLFAEYPMKTEFRGGGADIQLLGPPGFEGRLRFLKEAGKALRLTVNGRDGTEIAPSQIQTDFIEFAVPADGWFQATWPKENTNA